MGTRPKTAEQLKREKDAKRKRDARALKRQEREAARSADASHAAPVSASDASELPILRTVPVTGPGADALMLDASALGLSSDASGGADAAAPGLVEPPPPPPPPPVDEAAAAAAAADAAAKLAATKKSAMGLAFLVGGIFRAGLTALLEVSPSFAEFMAQDVPAMLGPAATQDAVLSALQELAYENAVDVFTRRGMALPYQAEVITAGSFGIGVAGLLLRRRMKLEAKAPVTDAQRAGAVDASAVEVPASTISSVAATAAPAAGGWTAPPVIGRQSDASASPEVVS